MPPVASHMPWCRGLNGMAAKVGAGAGEWEGK